MGTFRMQIRTIFPTQSTSRIHHLFPCICKLVNYMDKHYKPCKVPIYKSKDATSPHYKLTNI